MPAELTKVTQIKAKFANYTGGSVEISIKTIKTPKYVMDKFVEINENLIDEISEGNQTKLEVD